MFLLQCANWSWDAELQIIHADVRLEVDGEVLVDEPLCVDVGLPALLYGMSHDIDPNRWADPQDWFRMPFFCCGCGDPECRAYSFRIRHLNEFHLELTELDERQESDAKRLGTYLISLDGYKSQVKKAAVQFLSLVDSLDYKPYFSPTVQVVKQLMNGEEPSI